MLDDVILRIEQKVENWTHVPLIHQEDMNILRYGQKQSYGGHMDSIVENGPRHATILMYLSDIEEGGETAFPLSNNWIDPTQEEKLKPVSECASGHLAVKPKKGDALLFFSLKPDGTPDEKSFHTGCPVLKGVKWTATIWVHTEPFRSDTLQEFRKEGMGTDPGICHDLSKSCGLWARDGECDRSEGFMIESCPLSCGRCKACAPSDHECYTQNRLKAGYPKIEDVY